MRVSTKEPGTRRSQPALAIEPEALATLMAQRRRQPEMRLGAGPDGHDLDLGFSPRPAGRATPKRSAP